MSHLVVVLDQATGAQALVATVHRLDKSGMKVLRLVEPADGDPLVAVANAVLALREAATRVTERELVELLELLPV